MVRNSTRSRLFMRGTRYWADLRAYGDVGGKREPLVPPGATSATTDKAVAESLLGDRIKDLERRRRDRALLGIERRERLAAYASHHLVQKKRSGRVTDGWIAASEVQLARAAEFLGADRHLDAISVKDVQDLTNWLSELPSPRGGKLTAGSVRHHLNTLSNLFRRAQSEGVVPPGYNPVSAMLEKPVPARQEADWLEVHDAALLLEAARLGSPSWTHFALPAYPLVATFLLTGGRKSEVLGLEVGDVSFERRTVIFRPNDHRRLKTMTSHRVVPLWPHLEEVLQSHVGDRTAGLLFPSPRTGGMIHDTRRTLDAVARAAGWDAGDIRTRMFRHTYCAARLQTLDRGAAVSSFTVARELGHGGDSLVKRIYGHLGQIRHRSEVVEYRVEQHRQALGERLTQLRAYVEKP